MGVFTVTAFILLVGVKKRGDNSPEDSLRRKEHKDKQLEGKLAGPCSLRKTAIKRRVDGGLMVFVVGP